MKNIKSELRTFLENVEVKSVSLKEVSFKVSELLEDNENTEMEVKLKNKIPTKTLSKENLKKVKEAGKRILQVQEE
ncbi:MAG: hypothetical protein NZM36_03530 [Aquificaceae bacterium]|nr:hypothetical protein [Aquificaceae bacterium]